MNRPKYFDTIKNRINEHDPGTIFITTDFLDIAPTAAVNKALSRLVKNTKLRRIARGLYELPKYNSFLEEYVEPDPQKAAAALARNYGWTISPYGDTALNLLGLSTQVPAVWLYVSDGPYKNYIFNGFQLEFKHRSNKEISKLSPISILVIQAFKSLGKKNITNSILQKLASTLSSSDKQIILKETQHSTAWIYEYIKKIYKKEGSTCKE